MTKIGELITTANKYDSGAIFRVQEMSTGAAKGQRLPVVEISAAQFQERFHTNSSAEWLWALPQAQCGDSPTQYHPKFVMALLSSLPAKAHNLGLDSFLNWTFPSIAFETEEWTRRSMTLNGMRMSTEFFASGSPRVLQLIEQRLEAGQADVVHDVMVYLMQRVLEIHASMDEERALQAESLAAYLGLNADQVQALLFNWPVEAAAITQKIESGFAGTPRSVSSIAALIENQLARFSAEFQELKNQEEMTLRLIDEVVIRLYNHGSADC